MNKTSEQLNDILDEMADELRTRLSEKGIQDPLIVGIHTAGVWIAEALKLRLGIYAPHGELNINFYRDDFSRNGLHPQIQPSKLPITVDDQHIVLIDDVLFTGRTIRAAMNELFDYGRPASIMLVVLFQREGRELPICAEITGITETLEEHEYIDISGPEPMELVIRSRT